MSSSQATLGYVRDPQTTLGKFFGGQNMKKFPAKQSKLSFSSKATAKEDKSETIQHVGSAPASCTGNNSTDQRETELKKRARSPHQDSESCIKELESDDEEPILKRSRTAKLENSNGKTANLESKTLIYSEIKQEKFDDRSWNSSPSPKHPENKEGQKSGGDEEKLQVELKSGIKLSPKTTALVSLPYTPEPIIDKESSDVEEEKTSIDTKMLQKTQVKLESDSTNLCPEWKPGEPVPYAALCATFSLIEMTSKRLLIASYCSLFLRKVLKLTPDDLLPTVLLMVNKLAADYAGIELGIGESLIMKAIGESTGRSLAVIKDSHKEIGDLGLVAVQSRAKQPTMFAPKPLTVRGVHKDLVYIATVSGQRAQSRKIDYIKKLLSAADTQNSGVKIDNTKNKGGSSEAKFIVRFLEGKLRLGLAEKTVLISLAQAFIWHEAESKVSGKPPGSEEIAKGEAILKTVYSEIPSYEIIIPTMISHGILNLREHCQLQPGIPLKPMLAKPTKAISEVLDRFENHLFTCEFKYDGERAQIHYIAKDSPVKYSGPDFAVSKTKTGDLAAIFSRNSEDLSKKYPDILAKLDTWVKPETSSFVMDCESVAWDVVEKKILPFQQLMTRKKKDVRVEDVKIKVCVYAFDLLYLNGEAIVHKPLRDRRSLLHTAFTPVPGEFAFATGMDGKDIDEIQNFLDESMKASCEGLMVKMLDGSESSYEPSKRSRNWLKIKKDYLSGIGDSLDLVVLGAYYGRGKRTSVYGAFLLACYNYKSESYETICNIGTGFSEAVLEELYSQLSAIVIDHPKPFYTHATSNAHQPDVWFEPKYVWEVKTADLTLSPRYKAAYQERSDNDKGISLRFPRFIRIREDKKPETATKSSQVAEMYRKQESVMRTKEAAVDDGYEY
ncbi:BgTH12-00968 [Blumeria graminis f. sp. triticale]|nr:BgTH12-00968 [Blumeria graminis f. sp. triticale]